MTRDRYDSTSGLFLCPRWMEPLRIQFHSLHPLQLPNRRHLLLLVYMAVSIHRQPGIAVPRQGLSRLGRHVRPTEVRDESVPHGVEIGVEAFGGLVAEEV